MSAAYFSRSYGSLRGLADRKNISQNDAIASLLKSLRRCFSVIAIFRLDYRQLEAAKIPITPKGNLEFTETMLLYPSGWRIR
jgi:hypothetical protein